MISNPETKISRADAQRQIRWTAAFSTAGFLVLGTWLEMYQGDSLLRSITIAAARTAGGPIAWILYHLVSRRNTGIIIFAFPCMGSHSPAHSGVPLGVKLPAVLRLSSGLILVHCIFAVICRDRSTMPEMTFENPTSPSEI